MMSLVTISTIYQTGFAAFLYLLSKGWMILRSSLTRNQATHVTMLMGAVYLSYSAYYVSMNMHGIKNFINFILNGLYIFLFLLIFRNCIKVLRVLNNHQNFIVGLEGIQIQETLKLKIGMMKRFIIISSAYFLYEILFNGLLSWLKNDGGFNSVYVVINQIFDFMITLTLLATFRPRIWPEYFNLSIIENSLLGLNRFRDPNDQNHF